MCYNYESSLADREAVALSNFSTQGAGGQEHNNSFASRRDTRINNNTGSLPVVGSVRGVSGPFDFEAMIASLRELFERDRQIASQPDSTRCGICYLHFPLSELTYREKEGFYICSGCERQLGKQQMPMLRRQQKK
jgi:hypothetical protein